MTKSLPSVTIVRRIKAPPAKVLRGAHRAQTNDAVVGS